MSLGFSLFSCVFLTLDNGEETKVCGREKNQDRASLGEILLQKVENFCQPETASVRGSIHLVLRTIASFSSNVAGDIRAREPGIVEKYLCQELMIYEMKMLGPPALHDHFTVGTCSWPRPMLRKDRQILAPDISYQRKIRASAK